MLVFYAGLGCPACKKRINKMSQFLDHLANDAMPKLLDNLHLWDSGLRKPSVASGVSP
jgi:hypothetical protein